MSKAKQPTTRAAMPVTAKAAKPAQAKLARDHFTDDLSSVTGLAQIIAALMNHPLIPDSMYNDLGDSIASLDMYRIDESPQYVEAVLHNHFAAQNRRAAEREENR
jgi:hypothetical protein